MKQHTPGKQNILMPRHMQRKWATAQTMPQPAQMPLVDLAAVSALEQRVASLESERQQLMSALVSKEEQQLPGSWQSWQAPARWQSEMVMPGQAETQELGWKKQKGWGSGELE